MSAPCLRPIAETMEDRILHSVDLAPLAFAGGSADALTQQPLHGGASDSAVHRQQIVFVDAGLPDVESLLADLQAQRSAGRPIEIVVMAAGEDGVALIGATLAERHDIAAVHVLAHGSDGVLQLGNARLDAQTLLQRAAEVAAWSTALTADADLLLYGCDLAQTAAGQRFVQDLAALTGADVAASTDLTGAATHGGNWSLEYSVGQIQSTLAPSAWEQLRWNGVLATYTVTTTADGVLANLLTGSLRWAISQANANAGTDTIVFAVNGTFGLAGLSSGDDNNGSGDLDVNGSLNIVGNGTANTVINGGGDDRVLDLRTGTINLSGLTIQGGKSNSGAGVRVNSAATATLDNVVVQNNFGSGSSKGGGIYNDGSLTLRKVIVQNNADATDKADGGGIYLDDGASLDARDVEIRNNAAADKDGGGLYVKNNGSVTLSNVTFADNQAKRGGGIWIDDNASATLVIVTLSGNIATSEGGGLWTERAATLDHVTVAYNTAPAGKGGGVFDKQGEVVARSSLFAANAGGNTNQDLNSLGYNLSDDTSAGFTATGDRNNVPAGLLALANNGGFTRTHAIGPGSAAVNAANPSTSLSGDQRGIAHFGGRSDIGAYEYNPNGFAPTVSAVANQSINEDIDLGPLAFTVSDFETAAGSLVITATSSNTALVPNANIVIGGSGASRTISLTLAPDANSSANGGPATITISVSDGSNITVTTFTVTVAAVNDAPTVAMPVAQSVGEDTTLTLSGTNAPSILDVDVGTSALQITIAVAHGLLTLSQTTGLSFVSGNGSNNASMTFIGSQSAINAALAGLQYRAVADYNGPDQLDLSVNDLGNSGSGGAKSAGGSLAITVNAVNDAPTLGLPGSQATPQPTPLTFSTADGNAIMVSDLDAAGSTLEVTLRTDGIGNGTLTLGSQAGLTLVSAGGWTNETSIVFRGSQADINAALQTLSFTATGAGAARLDIAVDDLGNSGSGGARQVNGQVLITVVNDALPVLTLSQTTVNFTENGAAVMLDPGLTVTDADNPTLASATVRIGSGYAGTEDVLAFTNDLSTMGNIVGSYSSGSLVLASAGQTATLAEWQAALRSVTYVNLSDAPSTAARTFTWTVNDGTADSAARSITATVAAVNDAPLLAGANDMSPIGEDLAINYGTWVSGLIAGQITDADSAAAVGIAVIGVDNSNGSWQYTVDAGATWIAFGSVTEDAARLLTADASTAVRFVPAADWNGTVTGGLTFRAWDQSTGIAGGTADARVNGNTTAFSAAQASSTITVSPGGDAPVLATAIVDQVAGQGTPFSFGVPGGTFTDIDAGDTLSYGATLASGAALPGWLSFDTVTQTFSGTPGNAAVGDIVIRVTATDGAGASASGDFTLRVVNVNDAPVLAAPLPDVSATQGIALSVAVPADTFTDPDIGDTLSYSATLTSGAALPGWLSFDTATQTFSGTPTNASVGAIAIRVTATDSSKAAVFGDFTLTVANANDAPVLASVIANQAAVQGAPFAFAVPSGTFTDADAGDTLSYSATLASGAALPGWLNFDPATQSFTGTPGNGDVGTLVIRVCATDGANAPAYGDFTLGVANVNDAPVLSVPIGNQTATQDAAFSFALPAGTFTDIDAGDVLGYRAGLPSGAALPAWLRFDAASRTFIGTPGSADVGTITLRVTATDARGASVFGDFALTVLVKANDAPRANAPIADQSATVGTAMQFQVPAATFSDADTGDTLRYAATLADGSALPPWLSFDAQTRMFIGQPATADIGQFVVRVTATDDAGAAAQILFSIRVAEAVAPAPAVEVISPALLPPAAEAVPADEPEAPAATPVRAAPGVLAPSAALPGANPSAAALIDHDSTLETATAAGGRQRETGDLTVGTRPASRGDAVLATALVPQFGDITLAPMMQMLREGDMLRQLDELQRRLLEQGEERRAVIASTIAVTGGLSIGYVVWLVRGGVLVSSMLSALPAWQMIDPLPVLAAAGTVKGRRKDAPSDDVERLFDEKSKDLPKKPSSQATDALPQGAHPVEVRS